MQLQCSTSECSAHDYSSYKIDLRLTEYSGGGVQAKGRVNLENVWATFTPEQIKVTADLSYILDRVAEDDDSVTYDGYGTLSHFASNQIYDMELRASGSLKETEDVGLRLLFFLIPFVNN